MISEEEKKKILGIDRLENVAGITRKLDTLGRIVIPKEARKMLNLKEKEKIIDSMSKYIARMDIDEDICKKIKGPCKNCDECIKDFFNKN